MHINFSKTRQIFIFTLAIFLFAVLFARLLYVQIIRSKSLSELADKQHKIFIKLEPQRGNIYDRAHRVLAMYLDVTSIYAVPKEIKDKEKTASLLAEEFDLDKETLLRKFKKDNYFAWVKRKVDDQTAEKARGLKLKGLYVTNEAKRFYPCGTLACHILGITGIDNEGLEGAELYYDKELAGEYGWKRSFRDAKRREVISSKTTTLPARNGNALLLTIDQVIQHAIEKEVGNIVKTCRPKAVCVIAMDPKTGEVLGLANFPVFDPNDLSTVNTDSARNRAITDSFEPGSVFKIVTASAALEEGVVDFETEFFCENGNYKVGKKILHDYRPYGRLKFREIIEKSSNIGVAKVAEKLGKKKLIVYIDRFNFDTPTGIDLPGEVSGIMRDPSGWSYVDMTTIPIGQGIAVTAVQLVTSISAIANDGILMKPYVAKAFLNEEGMVVKENNPVPVRRVLSEETAAKVKRLLEGVVEQGTGRQARLADFRACGKTGTAQKVKPGGGYYDNRYVASFIGFAPYDDPAVALAICIDEPCGKHFGGQIAAPAFKNIMEDILAYMEKKGDRREIKKAS